jgi:hypothetical protein
MSGGPSANRAREGGIIQELTYGQLEAMNSKPDLTDQKLVIDRGMTIIEAKMKELEEGIQLLNCR